MASNQPPAKFPPKIPDGREGISGVTYLKSGTDRVSRITSELTSGRVDREHEHPGGIAGTGFPASVADACVGVGDYAPGDESLVVDGQPTELALMLYLEGAVPPHSMVMVETHLGREDQRRRLVDLERRLQDKEDALVLALADGARRMRNE